MTAIRTEQLTKRFGTLAAVDQVSLTIHEGELFFLLGPSGCGKTTLLRMLAGFIEPDDGQLFFDDRRMNGVPPRRRDTGMVFQNYALWPHLTVAENVAYGLDVRRVRGPERAQRVRDALQMVRMEGYESHRPTQLSGGQQQRIALARALVIRPAVLLLDEPLSNLDARLRSQLRDEIRRIHAATKITTVYVTHDQKEALSLADRIAVMDAGRVVQVGPPRQIYERPADEFVAQFLGDTNLIRGTVEGIDLSEQVVVSTPLGKLAGSSTSKLPPRTEVVCSLRPETLRLDSSAGARAPNQFTAVIEHVIFLGELKHVHILGPGGINLLAYVLDTHASPPVPGQRVTVTVPSSEVIVFPAREQPAGHKASGP